MFLLSMSGIVVIRSMELTLMVSSEALGDRQSCVSLRDGTTKSLWSSEPFHWIGKKVIPIESSRTMFFRPSDDSDADPSRSRDTKNQPGSTSEGSTCIRA